MDDYSDNERGRNADFTLAVLAFSLNAIKDEQDYRQSHEQFQK